MPSYEEFMQLDERRLKPRGGKGRGGKRGGGNGLRDAVGGGVVAGAADALVGGAADLVGNEWNAFKDIMKRRADNTRAGDERGKIHSHKQVS